MTIKERLVRLEKQLRASLEEVERIHMSLQEEEDDDFRCEECGAPIEEFGICLDCEEKLAAFDEERRVSFGYAALMEDNHVS